MGGVTHGGRRQGSGRHCSDTVRIGCSILRPIYQELVRQEKETGVYRCQIVGRIVTENLIGAVVDRELRAVRQSSMNGAEPPLPDQMPRSLANFHR